MKIRLITTSGIIPDVEVESIEEFCRAIQGSEWVRISNGLVRTNQIVIIVPESEEPTIAEVKDGCADEMA